MKYGLCFIMLGAFTYYAQDTTVVAKYPSGYTVLRLVDGGDSTYQYLDETGLVLEERQYQNNGFNGYCKGWYQNGNLRFEKKLEKGEEVDTARFYNFKGKLVATVIHGSEGVEELYSKTKEFVFAGTTRFNSVIYGGMEREDGSSNISSSEGPIRLRKFVICERDKDEVGDKVAEFTTDIDGNYLVLLPQGTYTILPMDFYERYLKDPSLRFNQSPYGWTSTWHGVEITLTQGIYDHKISSYFEGYAP